MFENNIFNTHAYADTYVKYLYLSPYFMIFHDISLRFYLYP